MEGSRTKDFGDSKSQRVFFFSLDLVQSCCRMFGVKKTKIRNYQQQKKSKPNCKGTWTLVVHTVSSLALVALGLGFIVSPATRQQEVNILAVDVESRKKNNNNKRKKKYLTMLSTIYFHSAINKTLWSNCSLSLRLLPQPCWLSGRPPLTWQR